MYDFGMEEKEFQLMLDVANEKMALNETTFSIISDTMRRVRDSGKLDDYTRSQADLLCNNFSVAIEKLNNKTEYEVAMEEMSGGMMALVAAAIGVVLGIIIKIVSIFGGGSSGTTGGSSPTKEEHKKVNETNYEISKTVLSVYEIIENSNIEGLKEIQKETLEKYMNKQNINKLLSVGMYVSMTNDDLYEKLVSDVATADNKTNKIYYASIALGVIKYVWDKIVDKSLNKENINEILSKVNTEDMVNYSDNKLTIDLSSKKEELIKTKEEFESNLVIQKDETSNDEIIKLVAAINKTLNEQGLFKLKHDRVNILEISSNLTKIVQTIKTLQSNIENNKNIDLSSDFNTGIISGLKEGLSSVLTIYSITGSMFVVFVKMADSVEEHILNTAKFIERYTKKINELMNKETDNAKKDLLKKHLDEIMKETETISRYPYNPATVKGDGLAKKFTLANSVKRTMDNKNE